MNKRSFRSVPDTYQDLAPSYPTLDDFDRSSRRSFLARLGAALAGAGGLAVLGACGQRAATMVGKPPDARLDAGPPREAGPPRLDGGKPALDSWPNQGGRLPPDARADRPPRPDVEILAGEPPGPDARIDAEVPDPSPGFASVMDARVDEGSCRP